ncbi:intraflagellar transport protein 43 [Marchantia polymorpha subsp. ruderalis]|uniref:Uncharacterized protein n=2 Tax=Marchantia polymorpha TaxID=3197 RepID=A0AAF6B4M0_MARPO|nr:hypothetical protein MARPO_0100s0038 [Marchantia polymorpha]PTQ32332.1 hypothetical protein MARPO_0100s0038 [Marchantia polymorpha]BBN06953.1 hypothetical protein Mp_3g25250 [Marchantia polymorpha subsp. ruderalis]BBN06954.1 hypothetical protein Mp_3g25250 [Marchantia polymorpha subsp. ruderalis]|eukprot:PTQ32331.1 hypothetical protein MARPO_0100s0038 [Marchantia polymorpha]
MPSTSPSMQQLLKFIIVGDSGVGKACIMMHFIERRFQGSQDPNVGIEFGTLSVTRKDKLIKLQIWNSARQAALPSVHKSHYKGAAGVVLVYDITRRETFNHLSKWLEDARKHGSSSMTLIVLGNKCDMSHKRAVSFEEGEQFCKDNGLAFFEGSAKTAQNIEEAFVSTALKISQIMDENAADGAKEDRSPPKSKVGWDISPSPQDQADGVFKLITGRRQRGSNAQAAPDRSKHSQEDETQDIPELQDGSQVTAPPRVIAQRVPSFKELDTNMPYLLPFTYEGGIDLRPLISSLSPVSQVSEEDTHWDPKSLLAEMIFKMNENKEVLKCGI